MSPFSHAKNFKVQHRDTSRNPAQVCLPNTLWRGLERLSRTLVRKQQDFSVVIYAFPFTMLITNLLERSLYLMGNRQQKNEIKWSVTFYLDFPRSKLGSSISRQSSPIRASLAFPKSVLENGCFEITIVQRGNATEMFAALSAGLRLSDRMPLWHKAEDRLL